MAMQTYGVLNFKDLNTRKAGPMQRQMATLLLKLLNFKTSLPALPQRFVLIRLKRPSIPEHSGIHLCSPAV